MSFTDQDIINQIAAYERSIAGVRHAFDFAKNPNSLTGISLPVAIHYPGSFTSTGRAFHNVWNNTINITSVLFVAPRQLQGGNLSYLENEALPYGDKWRSKFQNDDVIRAILAATGAVKCFLQSGQYGAGGPTLEYGGVAYLGWIFQFQFNNA